MDIITSVIDLMKNVINEEENRGVLQTDHMRPMLNLLLDIATLFPDQRKEAQEALMIWMQLLHNCLTEAITLLHRPQPGRRKRCLNWLMCCNPGRLSNEINEWKVLFAGLFQQLQSDLSIFVTAHQTIHTDPFPDLRAEESEQPLSEDEAWMLFQRIAFKDGPVPMDIELCARNIVDACQRSRLAISVVAAAMIGKTSLLDWETSFYSMKNADATSHPARIDPQLYQLLRWSFDALPSSDLKNCFLYSAISNVENAAINVEQLVQMWIAEGLVRSKQETHLMDMAIVRTYVKLLLDRRLFHNVISDQEIPWENNGWLSSEIQSIRVDGDIREMAMFIAEKDHNCLFNTIQGMFPSIEDIKDCKRISLPSNGIEDLPNELPCPKLVSLLLNDNIISVVPSGFLVGLKSLKVLDLSGNSRVSSIPSSVGQLQQLQLLRLERLYKIENLPEEIGQLSSLQFLSLDMCSSLESLPSQIGQLQNLKYLNISWCKSLRAIPHEISQLTSLTTLDAMFVELSVEAESERSICRLKGLINLTMLRIDVDVNTRSSGRIEGGIMGTWLDMRHLRLSFTGDSLPDDMQNMKKLQSFSMSSYIGLSLPEYICKFRHLQFLMLAQCRHLKELSRLERLRNLEELVLEELDELESIAGPSNNGVWNERTLSRLRVVTIEECPNLKRLPRGMDKLVSLKTLMGEMDWWQRLIWEDEHMKRHIMNLFKGGGEFENING